MATSPSRPGSDAVEHLDHGDLGAEPPPHRAELEPDIAGADDHQPLRHFGSDSAPVEETIVFSSMAMPGSAATSEPVAIDDGLGLDRLLLAVDEGDLDLARRGDAAGAVEVVDLVLLQQERDAVDIALNALVLEGEHGGKVELRLAP